MCNQQIPKHTLRCWLIRIFPQTDCKASEASQLFLHKENCNYIHCETETQEKGNVNPLRSEGNQCGYVAVFCGRALSIHT
jgi:hypothetical protein